MQLPSGHLRTTHSTVFHVELNVALGKLLSQPRGTCFRDVRSCDHNPAKVASTSKDSQAFNCLIV